MAQEVKYLSYSGLSYLTDKLEARYERIGHVHNYLPLAGGTMTGTITSQSIIPTTNTTYNLGSTSNQFNIVYTRYIDTVSGYYLRLRAAGVEHLNMIDGTVNSTANIIPTASNAYNLGSTDIKWKNVYATTFDGILNGSIAAKDIRSLTGVTSNFSNGTFNPFFSNVTMPTTDWWSGFTSKGWTNDYNSWQLVGISGNVDSSTSDLYWRNGRNDTWNSWKKILDNTNTTYTASVTSSTSGAYQIGTLKIGDTETILYGKNTTYSSLKNPHSLSIQKNGTTIDSYDGSVAKTVNITVPTKLSDFTDVDKIGTLGWYNINPYVYSNNVIKHYYTKIASFRKSTDPNGCAINAVLRFRLFEDINYPSYGEYVLRLNWNISFGRCVTLTQSTSSTRQFEVYVTSESSESIIDDVYHVWVRSDIEWSSSLQFKIEYDQYNYGNIYTSNFESITVEPENVVGSFINNGTLRIADNTSSGTVSIHTTANGDSYKNKFTADTFVGNLTGNVTGNVSGSSGSCTGNAATASTATKLTNSRTIWGQSFNGTANVIGDMTGVGSISMSKALTINGTDSNTANLHFGRTSYNYITGPSGSTIHMCPGGISKSSSTGYIFGSSAFYPGSNNAYSIGTTSLQWNNICGRTLYENGTSLVNKYAAKEHLHSTADITGTLPVVNGGTGLTTITAGHVLIGNGTSALTTAEIIDLTTNEIDKIFTDLGVTF